MLRTVLMLSLLALAAGAYVVLVEPPPARAAPRTSGTTGETLAISTPARPRFTRELPPLENLARTVERPLFSPTRRPGIAQAETSEPEDEQAQAAPTSALPDFVLTAVFRSGDTEIALLRDLASGKVESVRLGDEFDGWQVATIKARSVVLLNGKVKHELELRESERPPSTSGGATRLPEESLNNLPEQAPSAAVPIEGSAGTNQ